MGEVKALLISMDGDILSEEPSVSEANSAGSTNAQNAFIMLSNFNNLSSLVPFPWVSPNLVLDAHMVTHC